MMMSCYRYLALLFAFCQITFVSGSHFRGGTASWKHIATYENLHQVEVDFRLAWRRSSYAPPCDYSWVGSKNITGYLKGYWIVQSDNIYEQYSTEIFCTTYDIPEDWAYGYNSFVFNMTEGSSVNVTFQGAAWIDSLIYGGGGRWSLALSNIDTAVRSDTGEANNSPATLSAPIIKIQQGCAQDIAIPTLDEDGDEVTCRYAESFLECGDVCGSYPHFTLNQTDCSIHYDGGGGQYLVPVALMLEDHPRNYISIGRKIFGTSDTLSSIPLQFIVEITQFTTQTTCSASVRSVSNCNVQPTYPPYALQDGAVVSLAAGEMFNETLFAYPSTSCSSIDRFIVIGPVGMHQSSVIQLPDNLYAMQIWWLPGPDQSGEHTMCYYAVDTLGKSSNQRCIKIIVAESENTCLVENGGCSDNCISTSQTNTCSCSLSCWELASDSQTCIPDMDLKCDGESMEVYMRQCASDEPFVVAKSQEFFSELSCRSVEEGSYHYLNFTVSQCGTTYQVSAAGVEYLASVYMWKGTYYGESGDGDVITRGEWIRIPVSCTFPASANLTGSFVPILPIDDEFLPEEVEIEGMGTFSFSFEFYHTSQFKDAYDPSEYPIRTTVNDNLYFALAAVGRSGLKLFTEDCVATSTPLLTADSLFYYFIQDGCVLDPTLIIYNSPSPMELWYSIEAFQFEAKLFAKEEDSDVYITCSVILCDITDRNSRCSKGCFPGASRRRRSPGGSPVRIVEANNNEEIHLRLEDNDDDDASSELEIKESPPQEVSTRIILAGTPKENAGDGSRTIFASSGLIGVMALIGVLENI